MLNCYSDDVDFNEKKAILFAVEKVDFKLVQNLVNLEFFQQLGDMHLGYDEFNNINALSAAVEYAVNHPEDRDNALQIANLLIDRGLRTCHNEFVSK